MANELVAGANAPLSTEDVGVSVRATNGGRIDFAVAVLPIWPSAPTWLPLQDPPPDYAEGATSGVEFTMRLSRLSPSVETVALVIYTSAGATTLMPLEGVSADVGGYLIRIEKQDLTFPCVVFAELYRRNGAWKIRSKKEGVFDGIEELGRRLGLAITDRRKSDTPPERPPVGPGPGFGRGGAGASHPDWTGSGFMVADRYLVTNAHVVKDANSRIAVGGMGGRSEAEPVVVDEMNDLALLRLSTPTDASQIAFRDAGLGLGETVHAIGYPLAGLLGRGPQFTTGSVSNLLGPGDDARIVQVTCPIQPGSSGGPVFDDAGNLVAVVTATLVNTQNVNFAIRSALVLPLLEVAGIDYRRLDRQSPMSVSDIVRTHSRAVLRVECFG
jgi:S1-C subfamily serine protease